LIIGRISLTKTLAGRLHDIRMLLGALGWADQKELGS
jgi:hypothetical protein